MELREIPDPSGIRQAKTLPATAYGSAEFFDHERTAIFGRDWLCAGVVDEMPATDIKRALKVVIPEYQPCLE